MAIQAEVRPHKKAGLSKWQKDTALRVAKMSAKKASGSVVGFAAPDGLRFTLHRPHPGHELAPYQVLAVREFIEKIGGKPQ